MDLLLVKLDPLFFTPFFWLLQSGALIQFPDKKCSLHERSNRFMSKVAGGWNWNLNDEWINDRYKEFVFCKFGLYHVIYLLFVVYIYITNRSVLLFMSLGMQYMNGTTRLKVTKRHWGSSGFPLGYSPYVAERALTMKMDGLPMYTPTTWWWYNHLAHAKTCYKTRWLKQEYLVGYSHTMNAVLENQNP